jgi:hypothetical protein
LYVPFTFRPLLPLPWTFLLHCSCFLSMVGEH